MSEPFRTTPTLIDEQVADSVFTDMLRAMVQELE